MRISDWSSDVCSSDLAGPQQGHRQRDRLVRQQHAVVAGDRAQGPQRPGRVGEVQEDVAHEHEVEGAKGLRREVVERLVDAGDVEPKIGRASGRERVGQYGSNSVVAVTLKKTKK